MILTRSNFVSRQVERPRPITVFLADRHDVIVEGLNRMLALERDLEIVGAARDVATAQPAVAATRPQVALVELEMPTPDHTSVVIAMKLASPATRVLALAADMLPETIRSAQAAGADAFVAKNEPGRHVAAAIRALAAGNPSPITFTGHARRPRRDPWVELMVGSLSARELVILRHLAAGHSNSHIAKECRLTLNTVRSHIQSILVKLGVHSKVEAVCFAVRNDVVRLGDPPRGKPGAAPDGQGPGADVG
jgi:two-component system, NarL family, response regulator